MNAPPGAEALPFGEFFAVLRARGFILGLEHHLRLARLLARTGPDILPAELKRLLAPIFATDAAEQQSFYEAFDSFYAPVCAAAPDQIADDSLLESAPAAITPRRLRLRVMAVVGMLVLILVALFSMEFQARRARRAAPTLAAEALPPPSDAGKPTVVAPETHTAPRSRWGALGARVGPWLRAHPAGVRGVGTALPFVALAAIEWRRWRRRELLLARTRGRKPPFSWPVRIAAPKIREFHSQPLYQAARALRRRQAAETEHLDLIRTLKATLRAGGLPRLVHRRGTRVPEYLVLIESVSPRDHQAAFFDQLAGALEREGVFLERYFFRDDPRICWNARGSVSLADLRRRHPEHRLLLIGDGAGLLDPVTGEPAAWIPLLAEWRERILLTPRTTWSWREEALAAVLPLAPATVEAIATVPDLLESGASPSRPAGGAIDPATAFRVSNETTLDRLQAYLGSAAFEWLCGSALYPEFQWSLTLYLGAQLPGGEALLTEAVLGRLVRLPWMRAGEMPEDLRAALMAALPLERQRQLRRAVVALLENSPAPTGSHAADTRQLDISFQRHWLLRHERKARAEKETISALPFGEQTRSYAELRLHEAGTGPRLAFSLPRRLRSLVYAHASASLGLRPLVRVALAVVIASCASLGLKNVVQSTVRSQPNGSLAEIYIGTLGAAPVQVSLYFLPNGEVKGGYIKTASNSDVIPLDGKFFDGNLVLQEIDSNGAINATIMLQKRITRQELRYSGVMSKANGMRMMVTFSRPSGGKWDRPSKK